MNAEPLEIPVPHVDLEEIPLLEPSEDASEEMKSLFAQIPHILKVNGFGYYMKQVENELDLLDDECYASHLANYYSFNCWNDICSFEDWVHRVQFKVGGFRPGANPDHILHRVNTYEIGMIEGARLLFTRNQMVYYGW